ncbi:TPA: hypothetical protein EYN98_14375 [Candidatus Poribacteria bacterium]|nr:hypothetical protein [Candidatus Poribacteria bacterium]HIB87854.1 hypothetical protein [Candidatus Poribacteria bacterium]HIC00501.1 hypothetical protein [Candidatus Poribacteria bacterium]HIM09857.1 hypothetical protein [Candidatus Poribacteria bacterium]HIN30687.1 hypothetical protein [Candidatus Poribacteria bacterium]
MATQDVYELPLNTRVKDAIQVGLEGQRIRRISSVLLAAKIIDEKVLSSTLIAKNQNQSAELSYFQTGLPENLIPQTQVGSTPIRPHRL